MLITDPAPDRFVDDNFSLHVACFERRGWANPRIDEKVEGTKDAPCQHHFVSSVMPLLTGAVRSNHAACLRLGDTRGGGTWVRSLGHPAKGHAGFTLR